MYIITFNSVFRHNISCTIIHPTTKTTMIIIFNNNYYFSTTRPSFGVLIFIYFKSIQTFDQTDFYREFAYGSIALSLVNVNHRKYENMISKKKKKPFALYCETRK